MKTPFFTTIGSIIIIVSSGSSILTRVVPQSDQGTTNSVYKVQCVLQLPILIQISELRKYYANVPGACNLAEKCLQVRYFVQLVCTCSISYMMYNSLL